MFLFYVLGQKHSLKGFVTQSGGQKDRNDAKKSQAIQVENIVSTRSPNNP